MPDIQGKRCGDGIQRPEPRKRQKPEPQLHFKAAERPRPHAAQGSFGPAGLTPASLTTLCGELLAQNILFELGEVQQEDKRAGRRKILLGINYAYRHVLSISNPGLPAATSVTLCDLRGEHCITRRIPTDTSVEPEMFLKRVANVGKALLWGNSIGREELLGAGVSVPGPVDREKAGHPRLPRLGSARAGNCPAG